MNPIQIFNVRFLNFLYIAGQFKPPPTVRSEGVWFCFWQEAEELFVVNYIQIFPGYFIHIWH